MRANRSRPGLVISGLGLVLLVYSCRTPDGTVGADLVVRDSSLAGGVFVDRGGNLVVPLSVVVANVGEVTADPFELTVVASWSGGSQTTTVSAAIELGAGENTVVESELRLGQGMFAGRSFPHTSVTLELLVDHGGHVLENNENNNSLSKELQYLGEQWSLSSSR